MTLINQILVLAFFLFMQSALSADGQLMFEPVYGVETSLLRYPGPARYVTRASYGGRLIYGATLLAGELEVTEARSRQSYSSPDQTVEDTSQRAGLGIRSTIPLTSFAGFYFRAGGRASQGESKITTAGETETKKNPLRVDPYAGTGIQIGFSSNFALNAGVTLIRNAEGKYDSQYLFGISARLGNR